MQWNKTNGTNAAITIQKLKQEIEEMQNLDGHRVWGHWHDLKAQLDRAYNEEELYWSQKRRVQWLQEGDRNTSFFHASFMRRRKGNMIVQLEKKGRGECNSKEEVLEEVSKFYETLFTSEDMGSWESKVDGIDSTITKHINSRLIRPVEHNEIKIALFSMNPNKAPGMNGMTPLFFQSFWHIVGQDICLAINSFFTSSFMLRAFNHTLLSFIPKIQHPTKISKFRPISQCNVVYKIISKL